jgi:hypothetical protein
MANTACSHLELGAGHAESWVSLQPGHVSSTSFLEAVFSAPPWNVCRKMGRVAGGDLSPCLADLRLEGIESCTQGHTAYQVAQVVTLSSAVQVQCSGHHRRCHCPFFRACLPVSDTLRPVLRKGVPGGVLHPSLPPSFPFSLPSFSFAHSFIHAHSISPVPLCGLADRLGQAKIKNPRNPKR